MSCRGREFPDYSSPKLDRLISVPQAVLRSIKQRIGVIRDTYLESTQPLTYYIFLIVRIVEDEMDSEKLTLRLEKDLIEKAKKFAREHDTSVSRIVAGFFDNLEESSSTGQHGPLTSRLHGSLKPREGEQKHDEEDYQRHLEQKYG